MANTFAPFGFRPFGRMEGAAPTAGLTKVTVVASDPNLYFTGDVIAISSLSINSSAGMGITLPTTGTGGSAAVPFGIFMGVEVFTPTVNRTVWSAFFSGNVTSSAPAIAWAITDPDQLFIAQGSTTAVLGTSVIGWNIGFTSSETFSPQKSGNQTTGMSNVALLSTSVSANSSLPFRIIDVYTNFAPPGTNGTSTGSEAGQILVVRPNNTSWRSLTATST